MSLESPAAAASVRIAAELAGSITALPCGVISSFSYASSAEPDGDEKVSMASCSIVMVSQAVFVCMSCELCSMYKFNRHLSSESWPVARTLEIRNAASAAPAAAAGSAGHPSSAGGKSQEELQQFGLQQVKCVVQISMKVPV